MTFVVLDRSALRRSLLLRGVDINSKARPGYYKSARQEAMYINTFMRLCDSFPK